MSTHGAVLSSLFEALNQSPRGIYLSPHYNSVEVKLGEQILIPIAPNIPNCALFIFKYDAQTDQLELINP